MSFKLWREQKLLSQERVAEMSSLSLRTVQRLEAGHRVSYASLRALAAAFEIDVDVLERELYAVKDSTDEFIEVPRWIRRWGNPPWYSGPHLSRRDHILIEIIFLVCAVGTLMAAVLNPAGALAKMFLVAGIMGLAACYIQAVNIRIGDKYRLWPDARNAFEERPRTVRTILAGYTVLLSLGILGTSVFVWLTM